MAEISVCIYNSGSCILNKALILIPQYIYTTFCVGVSITLDVIFNLQYTE